MATPETTPLVWVKDRAGNRYLCPMNSLQDPNTLSESEKQSCVDDASRLVTREHVPSNEPEGKIKFAKSESEN